MKRMLGLCVVLAIALSACATTGNTGDAGSSAPRSAARQAAPSAPERKVPSRVPEFVRDAVRNTPEDVFVGIGTAKQSSISQSRSIAATRARAEISRQLDTVIRDMIRDFQASSELDPSAALSFQEIITVALSQSRLQGSSVVDENMDDAGNYWCVAMMSKGEAVQEINQAASQAKLRVPAAASFDAEKRMDEAFARLYREEIQVVDQ